MEMDPVNKSVYFFCRDNPNAYQDDVVVLAEGLKSLGWDIYGSCNYWKEAPDRDSWLIKHDPSVRHEDCSVVAVSYIWPRWIDTDFRVYEDPLPDNLFLKGRTYRTAYLDLEDGYRSCGFQPEFRKFDRIFRAKYNRHCHHPTNHVPWALGLSGRMIRCCSHTLPWKQRSRDLLVNFNASHPYVHPVRALMNRHFTPAASRHFRINQAKDDLHQPPVDPWDRLMWEQTQHRHCRSYYERLKQSQAVAAFCGELIPPTPFAPDYLAGGRKACFRRMAHSLWGRIDPRPDRLIQWDSWRFWESLAAGCLVFNMDLPHYGVQLPVMPENWVHYIGVRPDGSNEVFARLDREPELAQRIARQGREWAMNHYSPAALAKRFVETLL